MIRDYVIRMTPELDRLAERLDELVEGWRRDWLDGGGRATRVAIWAELRRKEERAWMRAWLRRDAPERWCGARLERGDDLTAALFGSPRNEIATPGPEPGLAAEVTARAVADLVRRCLADEGGDLDAEALEGPRSVPPGACAAGSGACEARFEVGGSTLRCLLSPAAVDAWLGGRRRAASVTTSALAPLSRALSGERVCARGVLGPAELTLAALSEFTVGDVISLDQRLDQPSKLVFPTLGIDCDAYLCERDGCNALLLDPSKTSTAAESTGGNDAR